LTREFWLKKALVWFAELLVLEKQLRDQLLQARVFDLEFGNATLVEMPIE
jgi:hypothetical protein